MIGLGWRQDSQDEEPPGEEETPGGAGGRPHSQGAFRVPPSEPKGEQSLLPSAEPSLSVQIIRGLSRPARPRPGGLRLPGAVSWREPELGTQSARRGCRHESLLAFGAGAVCRAAVPRASHVSLTHRPGSRLWGRETEGPWETPHTGRGSRLTRFPADALVSVQRWGRPSAQLPRDPSTQDIQGRGALSVTDGRRERRQPAPLVPPARKRLQSPIAHDVCCFQRRSPSRRLKCWPPLHD